MGKNKKSPITNIRHVDGVVHFEYAKRTYRMQHFADSSLHRESDNLQSVVYDREKGLHVITTTADFGGLGKDAIKRVIIPLESWLSQYCELVT